MTITLPLRLSSPMNGSHGHWRTEALKRKKERRAVAYALCMQKPLPSPPVVVTLTRVGKRLLDDDNLAAAFKSCRDECAAQLGCGDSERDPISWRYKQRQGSEYSIEISIEPYRGDE